MISQPHIIKDNTEQIGNCFLEHLSRETKYTLFILQCADRFQRADRMDFIVDSFLTSMAVSIRAVQAST